MKKKLDYEQSVSRLEDIVMLLEGGELSLEEAMKLFEEGSRLAAECYDVLNKAEQKIVQLSQLEAEEEQP